MKAVSVLAASLYLAWAGLAAADCGPAAGACEIDGGSYHAVVPSGPAKGAVVFLHGWGGTGEGSLRMREMVETFTRRGYVVIAPDGTPMRGPDRLRWAFRASPTAKRDDQAFLAAVKADGAARFGFDPSRVLLAGFSNGAFMTTYIACRDPDAFAAYAPVGGTFWRIQPEKCAGPVKLLQTHGWSDTTVPLEGRMVRGSDARDPASFVQGDVFAALDLWRTTNGCVRFNPDMSETDGTFWRRVWEACAANSALELAIHPGGHSVPEGWAQMAIDWFEAETLSN